MMAVAEFTLYGMDVSPYTAKLRAYLAYKGIAFRNQLPSLFSFYGTIPKRVGNATIPVLVTPEGEWLQDTSIIIERLEQRFVTAPIVPREPLQRFVAHLIELWADEFWHSTIMHTRWSYPENFPYWENEAMRAFAPGLPRVIARHIVAQPVKLMKAHLPRLGVTPEQIPQVERWTEQQCETLNTHFATMPFLLGTRPSLADFALFGQLQGHLGCDVRSTRVYLAPRPHLQAWMTRMKQPQVGSGEFLADDALPPTLMPILRSIFDEMVPYMKDITHHVQTELSCLAPGERLPRFVGECTFPFAGKPFVRLGMPYTLWMAQRALDLLAQMQTRDETRLRAWLDSEGGRDILEMNSPRLRRTGLQAAAEWSLT